MYITVYFAYLTILKIYTYAIAKSAPHTHTHLHTHTHTHTPSHTHLVMHVVLTKTTRHLFPGQHLRSVDCYR